jgi:hypothetical protein
VLARRGEVPSHDGEVDARVSGVECVERLHWDSFRNHYVRAPVAGSPILPVISVNCHTL